jgi:hypothetical protein
MQTGKEEAAQFAAQWQYQQLLNQKLACKLN